MDTRHNKVLSKSDIQCRGLFRAAVAERWGGEFRGRVGEGKVKTMGQG